MRSPSGGIGPAAGPCRRKVTGWRRSTPSRKPNTPLQKESAIQANSSAKMGRKIGFRISGPRACTMRHISTRPTIVVANTSTATNRRRQRALPAKGSRRHASVTLASRIRSRAIYADPGLGQALAVHAQHGAQIDGLLALGFEVDEQPPVLLPWQGFDIGSLQLGIRDGNVGRHRL